jgi:hypothetical protein
MSTPEQLPARYRIRIRGHLDPAWSTWFDSLTVTQADDGTTELAGPLADQAALFGLLAQLRDLGATLLLVERLEWEGVGSTTTGQERSRRVRNRGPRVGGGAAWLLSLPTSPGA